MKIQILFLAVLLSGFLAMEGCKEKSGPGESVEDQQLAKLSKTWKATSVTLDGVDKTSDYSNFTVTISGTAGATSFGYQTSGATVSVTPWPASGSWSFGATPTSEIIRDGGTSDERTLTYSVSDTELQITFNFSGSGYPGRIDNVNGQWVFVFGL